MNPRPVRSLPGGPALSGLVRAILNSVLIGVSIAPLISGAQDAAPNAPAEKTPAPARDGRLTGVNIPAGFTATKFAAPPDISYPTCIAAAPTGEVFVGVDQNGSLDAKPDRGWVVRCVDTDGDGIADSFKIFAKMDSPRGLVFDHNTLYVMHPPFIEAYYDDDGDGVADRSEVLVSGVGHDLKFRGADHTSNGLRLGIDGWLYVACGDYGATNAVAKDGSRLQLHGGGILRVRPDGSHLEMVVQGTRNIYDVAIDPFMNLLTCDNTNDGDDWNVRLSHMLPTARYGYPSLFRHFGDEMVPTMVDYGGGAPTGSWFLDEPGYPNGLGHGFLTCQWGWNSVNRHPLTPKGSSFTAAKEVFIGITRPTGIAEDGSGHLYVASWKGATFTYAGPDVGFIARLTPENYQAKPFPNLAKAEDEELLALLSTPSAVRRLHISREIVRRGSKAVFTEGLEKLAASEESLAVRVAAIFTLKQLLGAKAQDALVRLARVPEVREFALRAVADEVSEAGSLPTSILIQGLGDSNPRVRAQALEDLNRLGRREAAGDILPLTADLDTDVAHLAFRALVDLGAVDTCLRALDGSQTAILPGAMRALRNMHDPQVVDGLIERMNRDQPADARQLILQALCRLYYREADWDGSWWGTRPDTSGPYFKVVTWSQSDKIGRALRSALNGQDQESVRYLLSQIQLHKIDAPEITSTLLDLAGSNPGLRSAVVGAFADQTVIPHGATPLLEKVAVSSQEDSALRARAFAGLNRAANQPDAAEAAVRVLASAHKTEPKGPLARLRDEYIRDGRHARSEPFFAKLSASDDEESSQIGYAVLLTTANPKPGGRRGGSQAGVRAARDAIEAAWTSPTLVSLLRAVAETGLTNYQARIESLGADSRQRPAADVLQVMNELFPRAASAPSAVRAGVISKLPYPEVVAEAVKTPGDPAAGAKLLEIIGCVKCHTLGKSEPLKGPFLGDISVRYGRPEIIESILRPNAQIAQGFITTWVKLKDDQEFEGFIVREAGDTLEIRNLNGPMVLEKKQIAERGTRPTSIMPEGLVDQLTPSELASILAYFESLKNKPLP
jgi:putative heme-binding domain-containing protein